MIHPTSRRAFLRDLGAGFGSVAMAMAAQQNPLAPKQPHFPPKAKRVILLWMQGGPSQMDLFDFKPRLKSEAGNKIPFQVNAAQERYEQSARLMPAISGFKQVGRNGMWMSDLMPNLAGKVDELCFLRAMQTDSPAHPGAIRIFQTGSLQFVRPSLGSWVVYGLGTENQNLPGFITIKPALSHGGAKNWSSAFLPGVYQG